MNKVMSIIQHSRVTNPWRSHIIPPVRECWMIYRGPGFLVVLRCGSSTNPSSPLPSEARPETHMKTEKERHLLHGRVDGGGAKSNDGEKAWSSINHSILSASSDHCLIGSHYRLSTVNLPVVSVHQNRIQILIGRPIRGGGGGGVPVRIILRLIFAPACI